MDRHVKNFIHKAFNFDVIVEYDFRKLYGFTFAFKSEFISMKDHLSSASITPVGIIYEENGEFYLAPLYDDIEIEEVIKSYVEKEII